LKDHSAFIFRVRPCSWTAWPWRCRHYYPSKCEAPLS